METGGSEGAPRGDTAADQHERGPERDPVRWGRDGAEHRDGREDPPGTTRRQTRRGNQTHLREVPQHRTGQGKSPCTKSTHFMAHAHCMGSGQGQGQGPALGPETMGFFIMLCVTVLSYRYMPM